MKQPNLKKKMNKKGEIIEELMNVVHIECVQESLFWIIRNKDKHTMYVDNLVLRKICNVTKRNLSELNQLIYVASKVLQSKWGINQEKKKCNPPNNKRNGS